MTGHGAHVRRRAKTGRYRRVSHSPFAVLLRRLYDRHGWRLYAVPVLALVTVAALLPGHRSTSPARADASVTTQANTAAAQSRAIAPSATTGPQSTTRPPSGSGSPSESGPTSTASSSVPASSSARATVAPTTAPTAATTAATASKATTSRSAGTNAAYGQLISVSPVRSSTVCAHNTDRQHVFVSLADQHAWMCEREQLIREMVVTTGATLHDHATPRGTWKVQAKQADRKLNGRDYSVHVNYWVPFNGDYGFHDAAWQQMPFGTTGYRNLGSHGCVHLPMAQMKWFYHWVRVGAGVTITK